MRKPIIELAHEGEFVVVPWSVQVEVEIARNEHRVLPGSVPGKVAQDFEAVGWWQIDNDDVELGGAREQRNKCSLGAAGHKNDGAVAGSTGWQDDGGATLGAAKSRGRGRTGGGGANRGGGKSSFPAGDGSGVPVCLHNRYDSAAFESFGEDTLL